jgi:hypothetical protein
MSWFPYRRRSAWVAHAALASACSSYAPLQALPTMSPPELAGPTLQYLGPAFGRACQSNLLYFIWLESDSSLFAAKAAAVESVRARVKKHVVVLADVTIDQEDTSYLVYNEHCTLIHAKAYGYGTAP